MSLTALARPPALCVLLRGTLILRTMARMPLSSIPDHTCPSFLSLLGRSVIYFRMILFGLLSRFSFGSKLLFYFLAVYCTSEPSPFRAQERREGHALPGSPFLRRSRAHVSQSAHRDIHPDIPRSSTQRRWTRCGWRRWGLAWRHPSGCGATPAKCCNDTHDMSIGV